MSRLSVESVDKAFKGLQVLRSVSLSVEPGERHVIIGPNGAGKTTLLNCISGFLPIDAGAIRVDGREVSGLPPHTRVGLGLARTFQKTSLFDTLSVEQNAQLAVAATRPYRRGLFRPWRAYAELREAAEALLRQWGLWERRDMVVSALSYGEQRVLEVVLALASGPRLLLMDEPTSGMSPAETRQAIRLIQGLPRSVALLVIEHDMEVVFAVADRITVLHHGEVFLSGRPEEVRGDERVHEIYFGGGARGHA